MSYDCVIGDVDTWGAAAAAPVHWDRIGVCVCAGFAVPRVSSMPSPRPLRPPVFVTIAAPIFYVWWFWPPLIAAKLTAYARVLCPLLSGRVRR